MPIMMAPVRGVLFQLGNTADGQVEVTWVFQEKKHAVTGKDLPEAMENAVLAATAMIHQGGLL
jgi:uncharacterized protein YidB (DUF937 family)